MDGQVLNRDLELLRVTPMAAGAEHVGEQQSDGGVPVTASNQRNWDE
jgi:hypothetical protein